MKRKFVEIEKKKELAIWSKKLADIERERAISFSINGNPEVKTVNKTIIQKILRESKLVLLFIEIYSRQTYGY